MNKLRLIALLGLIILTQSCQKKSPVLTESDKQAIIDSAKVVVQSVFNASNNLEFVKGLDHYSADADAYYTNSGSILSLSELKTSYAQVGVSVERLENSIDKWNSKVLSNDLVAFTLPIHIKIKLKGIPEYGGQLVWSGIVQKQNGHWLIVQSHESWLNYTEMMTALTQSPEQDNAQ